MSGHLHEIATPVLILDRRRVRDNIAAMRSRAASLGITLRPHGKTAKNASIIRDALDAAAPCITASTLLEAEHAFEHGIADIVYAVGIAPGKLGRAAALVARGATLSVLLDSEAQLRAASEAATAHGVTFRVLLEIDCDGHRSGLEPDAPSVLELGRRASETPGVALVGVLTHGGSSYGCRSREAIATMAERERDAVVRAADRLRADGHELSIVSAGSTPTATFLRDASGLTELRAGVYVFQDLVMAGLGVCAMDDIAISVLTEVIGHQPAKGWAICDAGWMALSRDRGTAAQAVDQGYGVVCDVDGTPIPDLIVTATNQEHGIIARRGDADDGRRQRSSRGARDGRSERGTDPTSLPVGTRLRILPNHACATVAMHPAYAVVDGDSDVIETLEIVRGW